MSTNRLSPPPVPGTRVVPCLRPLPLRAAPGRPARGGGGGRARDVAVAAAWMLAALTLAGPRAQAASVAFINELHYDNAGSDVGEGVEIAGSAGLDLSGWSLLLYNGSNGEIYQETALEGVLPDQMEGVGTLFFALSGLQNGPDGVALVTPESAVIEFLSYEGAFTATEGAAAGLTSVDIGVFEAGGDAPGLSLQRTGSGRLGDDFVWQGPLPASYGALNAGQEISAVPLPGGLGLLLGALAGLRWRWRRGGGSAACGLGPLPAAAGAERPSVVPAIVATARCGVVAAARCDAARLSALAST